MTTATAIKKLEKNGFKVTQNPNNGQFHSAKKEGSKTLVEFTRNGREDEVSCIGIRDENDHSDSMTDYCATIFCRSLKQAITLAAR